MTPKIKALIEALAAYCEAPNARRAGADLWDGIDAALAPRDERTSTATALRALLPPDDSPPDADPKLLAMANAALVEQLQQVTTERDEARRVLLALADGCRAAHEHATLYGLTVRLAAIILNGVTRALPGATLKNFAEMDAALRRLAGA